MPHREIKPGLKRFARRMRSEPTAAEDRLWRELRDRRLTGLKFRLQVPIEGCIVDFVCLAKKLVVQVDGSQHAESRPDALRDATLGAQGFTVLRFWNDDVSKDIDNVCDSIFRTARDLPG